MVSLRGMCGVCGRTDGESSSTRDDAVAVGESFVVEAYKCIESGECFWVSASESTTSIKGSS